MIGIAVTTHNRPQVLEKCLEHIDKFTDTDYVLHVVDDASTPASTHTKGAPGSLYRFETNVGIARAKNKCLELLMQGVEVEHLFVFDDDTYPITTGWWEPYAEHTEPHLCYLFKDIARSGRVLPDKPKTVYDDGTMYALAQPRGCMMYFHRSVIERVGGYRPEFGIWGWEHVELSERIFHAGLTLCKFQDIKGSDKLLHCLDETWGRGIPGYKRSLPDRVRISELARNNKVYEQFEGSSDYVEYRDLPNLVITSCLTQVQDPQPSRRTAPKLTPADFAAWERSIKGALPVVLHDIPHGHKSLPQPTPRGWKRAASGLNPYVQRWVNAYQFLRHSPARWVFCTDGTDVVMLREPWREMEQGKLYLGWEPKVVGDVWLAQHHAAYRDWIDANGGLPLLNAGVCGGDHATVMEFAHDVATEGIEVDHTRYAGDMAALNKVAYSEKWRGRVVTGPIVTTVFKQNERNTWSWFKHK